MSYVDNGFPVKKGRVNLTEGHVNGLVLCVEDGSLDIVWSDDTTDTIEVKQGDAINLQGAKLTTIVSGKFHDD